MQLGPYQAEAYDRVEISAAPDPDGTERVVAKASGGPCGFAPDTEVLRGEFEGNTVLVGTLLLCQEGPEGSDCPSPVNIPVLATYNATDRALSALVRLRKGCQSRALKGSSLVVLRSTAPQPEGEGEEEGEALEPQEGGAAAPMPVVPVRAVTPEGGGSATAVAEAQAATPDVPELLKDGQRWLASGNFSNALDKFGRAMMADNASVDARVGAAASHLGQRNPDKALRPLEEARRLAPTRADIHLWLAYAWFQKGDEARVRAALDLALEKGWQSTGNRAEAPVERALAGELGAARDRRGKRRPGQAGAGSPRP